MRKGRYISLHFSADVHMLLVVDKLVLRVASFSHDLKRFQSLGPAFLRLPRAQLDTLLGLSATPGGCLQSCNGMRHGLF